MPKKLCKKEKLAVKMKDDRYHCGKCGLAANTDKKLCKPKKKN